MKHPRIVGYLLSLVAIAFSGCAPDQKVVHENPPVGMLMSNDHQITIHSGPQGPLYSVRGPDGERLASEISAEELQASFPDLDVSEIWAINSGGFRPNRVVPKTAHR